MEALYFLTAVFREPFLIVLVGIGTFAGVYIGALPGISGTMAISLLVSLTFGWPVGQAMALMVGVFVGVVYGAARPAILLNIPGGPSAVATALDGYNLAKKGLAGKAMGVSAVSSFFGTMAGILALAIFAPPIAGIAMRFRSVDYLMLAFLGLAMAGSLGSKTMARGIIAGAIGLLIGTIGIDPQTAVRRFTFDIRQLNAGVDFIVAMVGLFGASEVLLQIADKKGKPIKQDVKKIVPPWREILKHFPLTIRSSIIGVMVGVLPGAGGDIAALLSYDQAKRSVKKPTAPFGEGAVEGIIAPETANSAAVGGAFIPMLTTGIPGDAVTAVLISAMFIHGLRPGPGFMAHTPQFFWLIIALLTLAAFFLLAAGLTGIKVFTKIVEIPKGILMPIVLVLSIIGALAMRNNVVDIVWMFGFGVIGYIFKRFDYPVAPIILGLILSNLFESNFRRAVMLDGSIPAIFTGILQSYISIFLFVMVVFLMFTQTDMYKRWRKKLDAKIQARHGSTK
ncbi:MAG: tripartite tricarboxylate transporter permease [Spirochaetes bacterium]|nr:tripartite tricarboxylate transporter permease [Spirochaetota bacterium]